MPLFGVRQAGEVPLLDGIVRLVKWLGHRDYSGVPESYWRCPDCGERIIGDEPAGGIYPNGGGTLIVPASDAERRARCPVHGRPPFNDPKAPWR